MKRVFCKLIGLAILAPVVGTTGCVTQGTYDDLQQRQQVLESANLSLEEQLRDVEADRSRLSGELKQTQMQLEQTKSKVAAMSGTYDQLVSELRNEVASGQIEIQKVFDGIRLNVSDELLFPSGSTSLNESGRALLNRVAGQIKGEKAIVSVEGHTDNVQLSAGLRQRYPTNWELAAARAASVVHVLSAEGVDPKTLRVVSRGPFAPVASNDTKEGRAKNRRTEIILRPIPGAK